MEHWHRVENMLDSLFTDINDLKQTKPDVWAAIEDIVGNIDVTVDELYGECESWNVDDSSIDIEGYEDIIDMLPDSNTLSVEEFDRLKHHIEEWKAGR